LQFLDKRPALSLEPQVEQSALLEEQVPVAHELAPAVALQTPFAHSAPAIA